MLRVKFVNPKQAQGQRSLQRPECSSQKVLNEYSQFIDATSCLNSFHTHATLLLTCKIVARAKCALSSLGEDVAQELIFAHHWIKVTSTKDVIRKSVVIQTKCPHLSSLQPLHDIKWSISVRSSGLMARGGRMTDGM